MSDIVPDTSANSIDNPAQANFVNYPVEFRGAALEYFPIWIVNVFLCIITLYIYSPWAKVRTKRYFYGNTFIDNNSFDYLATPIQILKGRVIAVAALIIATTVNVYSPIAGVLIFIALAIALPWVIWRSFRFNARMSRFRNLRFGFVRKLLPLYGILIIAPLVIAIGFIAITAAVWLGYLEMESAATFGVLGYGAVYLVWPWVKKMLMNYTVNGHRYGASHFAAQYQTGPTYGIYALGILIGILGIIAVVVIIGLITILTTIMLYGHIAPLLEYIRTSPADSEFLMSLSRALIFAPFIVLLFGSLLGFSYFRAALRGYYYNNANLAGKITFNSSVNTWPLFWLTLSNYFILIITAGLAYPWMKIRLARFYANNTTVISQGSLDNFVAAEQEAVSALGEEIGEAFDMDVDIAI